MVTLDVRQAYEQAQGRWWGCNWTTHYGSLGLDLDGVSSRQAYQAARRWRALAADRGAGEVSAAEETCLVAIALHLRLRRHRGGVVCLGEAIGSLVVWDQPARHFCAEVLAREWEFAACWLEEIEADARWAEVEAE